MSILTNKVGVSITENSIQLVEIISKDNKLFLENVDEEYFEDSIYEDTKEAKFIHILQNAFNEVILRSPLKSNKISLTLPPSYFKVFEIPADKNLTKNDLNEYIKWELSKLFPDENTEKFIFRKVILDAPTFQSYKRVLVFIIHENILRRIHKFCVRNSLSLKFVDNTHISTLTFINESSTILSIYVEAKKLSAILFVKNNIVYQTSKQYSTISKIPDLINGIIEEMKHRELLTNDIEKLYFDGISVTSELKKNVGSSSNLTIKEFSPFEKLEFNQNIVENSSDTENYSKFASATSIALRIGL